MQEHVHTGPVAIIVAGISALLIFNLLRLVSAKLIDTGHNGAGETLGALVHFG